MPTDRDKWYSVSNWSSKELRHFEFRTKTNPEARVWVQNRHGVLKVLVAVSIKIRGRTSVLDFITFKGEPLQ